jgi:ribosome-associated protein
MEDLTVGPLTIRAEELLMRAVRSGGPGGQNVNKVASKVELRFDFEASQAFSDAVRARFRALVRTRLDADGRLLLVSQRTRDQHKNLEDARNKLAELIIAALYEPKRRKATKPSRAATARRVADKRHTSATKANRRRRPDDA